MPLKRPAAAGKTRFPGVKAMLKLYNFHASSTSYRTRIVLNLKGVPYEYIPIRLDKAEHLGAAYGQINPMRGVPTLEVDGLRLYQSSAIIEYLEEVYPQPALLPKDAVGRAQVRALAAIVGADMHPVNNLRIRNFLRDVYKQDADGVSAWIHLWNKAGFEAIEAMLLSDKNRRGFCYGSGPTIADAYLVSQVFSAMRFKTDMSPYAEIRAVVENCNALKPFADAHPSKQPDAQG
jgi:maleylpyruvate isomerase